MKEKILSALKTKYSNLGLTDKAFNGVADFLATTITDEENIDNSITGVEGMLRALQGDVDSRVSSAVAKAKAEKEKGGDPQPPKPKEDTKGDDTPEWAKNLLAKVEKLENQKQQETLSSKWQKAVSEKGIKNTKLAEKWMPSSEEEFETNLNDLVEFNKTILIEDANGRSTGRPASGSSSTATVSKETQSKIDSWAKSKETAKQD